MPERFDGWTIAAPPVNDEIAAILLSGWSARPPAGFVGLSETFDLWMERDEGVARRWREHAPYLLVLAKRWGVTPQWTEHGMREQLFFGEYVSRRLAAGRR